MMLRSSSTPILGSLHSSCSESPNNNHHHHHPNLSELSLAPNRLPPTHNKVLSVHNSPRSHNLNTFSCSSSPTSPSHNNDGFRRAQSEGNLASLARNTSNDDESSFSTPTKKFSSRHHSSLLEPIPSFSFNKSMGTFEDDECSEEEQEKEEINEYVGYISDNPIKEEGSFDASYFDIVKQMMALNEQMGYGNVALQDTIEEPPSKMFLAKGLGIDIGFGGIGGIGGGRDGRNYTPVDFSKGGNGGRGEGHDVEEHYKRMVNENPGNSLFLRNYAQFLYQSKKDLKGAEEYYSRAILADPNDGEVLSQYANLLWELHGDKHRATGYYERAVQAASEDSHVHAAYASFLWETEDEDEDEAPTNSYFIPPLAYNGAMTSATA